MSLIFSATICWGSYPLNCHGRRLARPGGGRRSSASAVSTRTFRAGRTSTCTFALSRQVADICASPTSTITCGGKWTLPRSASCNISTPDHLKAAEKMLVKFERVVREGPGMTWVRQRALCSLYFFIAECWIDGGRFSNSLRCTGAGPGKENSVRASFTERAPFSSRCKVQANTASGSAAGLAINGKGGCV